MKSEGDRMLLKDVIKDVGVMKIIDEKEINVTSLCINTDDVKNGSLYFCLNGSQVDGHDFAYLAKQKGASAIVCERPLDVDITQVVVKNSREAMSVMAANFYGNPQNKLKLIGITGTNGKTTTTYYVEHILKDAGFKVGVIGTIGVLINGEKRPASLTTPDPIIFFEILSEMVRQKVYFVVMEVSAHAIYWQKIFGIKFEVGALTNITQDHLDFFETFDRYKQTKLSFLTEEYCKSIVLNVDDTAGREKSFCEEKAITYGLNNPCDVFAFDYEFSFSGTRYDLNLFDDVFNIKAQHIGKFNLYNALCAGTVCAVLGIDKQIICNSLKTLPCVDGRLNVIHLKGNRVAVVDYAHTPDGLKNILQTVKEVCDGKVISLFGCGGNRDRTKRSIMGEISGTLADFSIITSDNPRFEKPMDIIDEIEKGIKKITNNYLCIEDRVQAIKQGLSLLKENDCLVVCGKGAENYIDQNGVKTYYSDYDTIYDLEQ